jgi:hypothetical protein
MNNFENVFGCVWNEILRCAQDDRSFLALLGMTKEDLTFLFERR